MHTRSFFRRDILIAGFILGATWPVLADDFGSGANAFTIDFATIGNPGNPDDSAAGGGSYFSPLGGVAYTYRLGVTEVPLRWVTKAIAGGLTYVTSEALTLDHPAGLVHWYEALAFANWLNITTGHQAAYNLTLDGPTVGSVSPWDAQDAYYFLPNDDEWYKAAFHKNDGATGNYWDFATGSDAAPTAVVSGTARLGPWFSTPTTPRPWTRPAG